MSLTVEESSGEPAPPDVDQVFDILRNRRRRFIIQYLRDLDGVTTIGDLSERLAAWENDVDLDEVTYKQRKRVYISLHQTHLPKLDEADVVEYDRRSGDVSLADQVGVYEAYLDIDVDASDDRRGDLGVGVFGVSAFALVLLAVEVASFHVTLADALFALTMTGLAVAAYREHRR